MQYSTKAISWWFDIEQPQVLSVCVITKCLINKLKNKKQERPRSGLAVVQSHVSQTVCVMCSAGVCRVSRGNGEGVSLRSDQGGFSALKRVMKEKNQMRLFNTHTLGAAQNSLSPAWCHQSGFLIKMKVCLIQTHTQTHTDSLTLVLLSPRVSWWTWLLRHVCGSVGVYTRALFSALQSQRFPLIWRVICISLL